MAQVVVTCICILGIVGMLILAKYRDSRHPVEFCMYVSGKPDVEAIEEPRFVHQFRARHPKAEYMEWREGGIIYRYRWPR